ncbi:MAG: phosphoribosyl-AMP cyclohydrolase [Deltaproteobacteria bacterium]|nr:phosphoribosyl-AMP cyclohydrolase [Deltaproteobacteria bacterium]
MIERAPEIDFDKGDGLLPVITQDYRSGRVLMLAYMNREAFDETITTGRACYFSRSRARVWRKGDESGNFQRVREIRVDCDGDTILLRVDQHGDGAACHEGYESCFYRVLDGKDWVTAESRKVDPAKYGAAYGHHSKSGAN